MALVRVQMSEPIPGVFVLNRADVPRRLFEVPNRLEVRDRAGKVVDELESLGTSAFCERYGIPSAYLDATETPRGRGPQLHPLF